MTRDHDKPVPPGPDLNCRRARRLIRAEGAEQFQAPTGELQLHNTKGSYEDSRLKTHLLRCVRCQAEAKIERFYRLVLAGYPEPAAAAAPDEIWFRGLNARIEREGSVNCASAEDSFARTVSLVARQMVPVMVALVLLIVGATLLWNSRSGQGPGSTDPVLMNQVVEYPQPTTDDVLGTLLAVEDKKNGK